MTDTRGGFRPSTFEPEVHHELVVTCALCQIGDVAWVCLECARALLAVAGPYAKVSQKQHATGSWESCMSCVHELAEAIEPFVPEPDTWLIRVVHLGLLAGDFTTLVGPIRVLFDWPDYVDWTDPEE